MTIGGWIIFGSVALLIIGTGLGVGYAAGDGKGAVIGGAIGLLLSVIVLIIMLWWFGNTASGKRAFKSQESNLANGLQRTVTIFDVNGNVIYEYEGKIDIQYDECRILFDDENGKRHIIYYTTGTVLIEEEEE